MFDWFYLIENVSLDAYAGILFQKVKFEALLCTVKIYENFSTDNF